MSLLDRCNPVARLLAAVVVTTPLLVTLDWVSAGVALGLSLLGFLAAGVAPATIARRAAPLLLLAPVLSISMLLYAAPGGREWFGWGLVHITDASITLAIATIVRVLALSLPVVLLFAGIDPTDAADGLAQVLRLPARLVLGALAGFRMMTLFQADWVALGQARRARGLGDDGRLRRWATMSFALLVLALRRGQKLATAMEARGFGAGPRTWARESRLGRSDVVLLAVAVGIITTAIAVSVAVGAFRVLWSR